MVLSGALVAYWEKYILYVCSLWKVYFWWLLSVMVWEEKKWVVSEREGSGGSSSRWPGLDLLHELLEDSAGSPRNKYSEFGLELVRVLLYCLNFGCFEWRLIAFQENIKIHWPTKIFSWLNWSLLEFYRCLDNFYLVVLSCYFKNSLRQAALLPYMNEIEKFPLGSFRRANRKRGIKAESRIWAEVFRTKLPLLWDF